MFDSFQFMQFAFTWNNGEISWFIRGDEKELQKKNEDEWVKILSVSPTTLNIIDFSINQSINQHM